MSCGYRVRIDENDYEGNITPKNYTGGRSLCDCPNCKQPMFTAFNIDFSAPELKGLDIWSMDKLIILFCPFCSFYMEPYYINFTGDNIIILGGDKTHPGIIQNIETPYSLREITLRALDVLESPQTESIRKEYLTRKREDGVYHQIGGIPFKDDNRKIICCNCNKDMKFLGILDYDDFTIPLYEDDHEPVALIIGDKDCMNMYSCNYCNTIGLKWVY